MDVSCWDKAGPGWHHSTTRCCTVSKKHKGFPLLAHHSTLTLLVGRQEGHPACKNQDRAIVTLLLFGIIRLINPKRTRLRQYKRGQYESYTVVHMTCLTLVVYILLALRTWINAGVYCRTSSLNLQPTSCLHNLLPPPRDPELLSRLRAPSKYPRIANRTKNTSHSSPTP